MVFQTSGLNVASFSLTREILYKVPSSVATFKKTNKQPYKYKVWFFFNSTTQS